MNVSVNDPGPYPGIPRTSAPSGRDHSALAPNERGKVYVRGGNVDDLTAAVGPFDSEAEERNAGDEEPEVGQRVFAPAWERVPKEPVPGHDEIVNHTDEETPERRALRYGGA
jgi:hypothetical protein